MIDLGIKNWLESVQRSLSWYSLLFIHVSAPHQELVSHLKTLFSDSEDAVDFLESPRHLTPVKLLTGIEKLHTDHNSMGRLRERIQNELDSQQKFLLLSTYPRARFARVPGSSIIFDAILQMPPHVHEVAYTQGLWAYDDLATRQALVEFGPDVCRVLDHLLYEALGDETGQLKIENALSVEALRSAGLVVQDDEILRWSDTSSTQRLKDLLPEAMASFTDPQVQFVHTASQLWSSERKIRRAVRARAEVIWNNRWREEVLDDALQAIALERAGASSYPNARSVSELRDPLEWITLTELLKIRRDRDLGSLGIPEPMWAKVESALVPVRSRLNSSQLLEATDDSNVAQYAGYLEQSLLVSGAPDPESTTIHAPETQRDLVVELRRSLAQNPKFKGDTAAQVVELMSQTMRYLVHTLDTKLEFTRRLQAGDPLPLESAVHAHFKQFLDGSSLSGRVTSEVENIGSGRADVVTFGSSGVRIVTEVKRESRDNSKEFLHKEYIRQTVAYSATNVPFGQLLILDLTDRSDPSLEHLGSSLWVHHIAGEDGVVRASVLVAVVRGNRDRPSRR